MKNVKTFLSAGVFILAVVGAFATTASKNLEAKQSLEPGYIKKGLSCEIQNTCTPVSTDMLCTVTPTGGAQVFGLVSPNVCTKLLWRPRN